MSDPKTEPAFPVASVTNANGDVTQWSYPGMSQYAYVAMHLQAAALSHYARIDSSPASVFEQTDLFFAELAKRTKS